MTRDDRTNALAASFDAAAEVYERARPGYPEASVGWLIPEGAQRVLDLGAGTGKFTRLLGGRGLDVVAVDPSEKMLDQLRTSSPEVEVIGGTAEAIPLPDASVDAVVCAQAWHWVDTVKAEAEVARVLRPGGSLGLVWNVRDDRADWVARMMLITQEARSREILDDPPRPAAPFGPVETRELEWSVDMDRSSVLELVASRSIFITAQPEEQRRVLQAMEDLLDTHPDLAGRESWAMPYRTLCFRTRLAG